MDALHLEQPLILLHQRVLRLPEDALEGQLVEILKGGQHGQPPDEFGDEAVLQQILRRDLAEDFAGAAVFRRDYLGTEADRTRPAARRDDLLEPGEGAAAYEQNIGGVNLQEFLLRMLAASLRRYRRHGAFHDLQQRLLHALARHVAGDRRIVGLAADLVDLVDIDDTALGALDIIVSRLQQLENDVLDILADIAGFRQRGRISHGERYVQNARQRLREQRLARPGRADQQDVGLREFYVVLLGLMVKPLVVIVNGDREHLLGMVLADHIVIEDLADFLRRRDAFARFYQRGLVLLADDVHAQLDAFVADEHRRAGNEFAHLVLALAAECAMERVLRIAAAGLVHLSTRTRCESSVVTLPERIRPDSVAGLRGLELANVIFGKPLKYWPNSLWFRRTLWDLRPFARELQQKSSK